jgi:hypothetical protein
MMHPVLVIILVVDVVGFLCLAIDWLLTRGDL